MLAISVVPIRQYTHEVVALWTLMLGLLFLNS